MIQDHRRVIIGDIPRYVYSILVHFVHLETAGGWWWRCFYIGCIGETNRTLAKAAQLAEGVDFVKKKSCLRFFKNKFPLDRNKKTAENGTHGIPLTFVKPYYGNLSPLGNKFEKFKSIFHDEKCKTHHQKSPACSKRVQQKL